MWATVSGRRLVAQMWKLSARLQLLFCIQRQLNHPFEQLIGGQSCEILEHELFDVEPHEVTELQGAIAGGEHKVAVAAVDHDDVALGVEAAAPQLAGGALEGVAGKAAGVDDGGGDCAFEAVGDRNQCFGRVFQAKVRSSITRRRERSLGRARNCRVSLSGVVLAAGETTTLKRGPAKSKN